MDIAAAVGAERLREIMAELLDRSSAMVMHYDGSLSQFTGDGIMAVFGAPIALEDHAVRACLAALGIQEEAKRVAAEVHDRDGIDLWLRVGLNSGQVIAGEIGSGSFGYTAVGEQVGMALRPWARLSWFKSRVPGSRCASTVCWASANSIALGGLSRLWSVGDGRYPPSRACWRARSMATARWSAWWDHPVLARAVWCARFRRWRVNGGWKCSAPSASRTPARCLSMRSRGCCARPPELGVWTRGSPGIECATE